MIEVQPEDWDFYEEKFGNLISYIAHRITGDPMCCEYEENVQDLRLAALNSITGYYKKNKITTSDMAVKEVIKCPLFKQYTKTVLWNAKNQKGNKATKYKNFMPVSLDTLENTDNLIVDECSISYEDTEVFEHFRNKLSDKEKELLDYIVDNPSTIRENGTINFNKVGKGLGDSFYLVKKTYEAMRGKLDDQYSTNI